jgi:uncharacterized repeat protein (TIGR01451 family)
MKTINLFLLSVLFLIFTANCSFSQNCNTVYGAGWNQAGSSNGVQVYNYSTNTWNGSSLEDISYFVSPNTINNGGPIAIDPLNQQVNFVTDANNTAAIFTFGTAPTFVTFPSNVSNVTAQLLCSGYKPASHICYYMSQYYLSSLPTPSNTGFFSVDFTNISAPVAKYYTPILAAGSPLVNTTYGGDICFDAHGVGYLVTAAQQLYTVVTDETHNTATFTFIANLNSLPFNPTAIAFDPMTSAALTITGGTSSVFANYNLSTNSTTVITNNAGWNAGDLASCYFPNLAPVLNVSKSVYNVTQASAPPALIIDGDVLQYTVVVKNTGNVNAGNLMIADTLPAGVTYIAGSTTLNGVAVPDAANNTFPFSTPTAANSGDQIYGSGILTTYATAGNPSAVLSYKVKVTGAIGTNVTNSATASVTGNDGISGVTSAGTVTFTVQQISVLPIDLLSFTANAISSTVKVEWKTANSSIQNNFEIEKSTDGNNFSTIGTVNWNSTQTYTFTDATPTDGNNFYRLKQIDAKGATVYSEIKVVKFDKTAGIIKIFPNPARPGQNIDLSLNQSYPALTIKVTTITGQPVSQQTFVNAIGHVTVNVPAVSRGIYFVTVINNNDPLQTSKLIVE